MARSKPLSLGIPKSPSPISSTFTSPTDHGSEPPSPSGRATTATTDSLSQRRLDDRERFQAPAQHGDEYPPGSPDITSLPPFPSSPKSKPKQAQESSKRFFSNLKASKSSNKVHTTSEPTIRQVSEELSRSKLDLSEGSVYSRPSPGSTPDLSTSTFVNGPLDTSEVEGLVTVEGKRTRRPVASHVASDDSLARTAIETSYGKKPKPRFANLINRTRSIRMEEHLKNNDGRGLPKNGRKSKPATPIITTNSPPLNRQYDDNHEPSYTPGPMTPMTAPLPIDRFPKDEGSPGRRNRSADRGRDSGNTHREIRHPHSNLAPSSSGGFKDGAGSHLFNNIRNTSSRAAGGLNKAGKGIIAKMNRSGSSTNQKEEERYVCRYINQPLIAQTRRTRLADRLENSKDRTEFWMPALPWRCIDYLNFRGCEEEGLYRVPGSDREIRFWQKRFDQEGDINLFDEDNLYDINVVGSLFKSWLRELPTDIFPKAIQTKIYQAHPDATEVPQLMKDELSMLPPWNYYLLFAITCHLSLLTAYAEKNRMTYSNLVICFQPCLRIDNYCFQFLVQKWRDCWQGCWTEKETLEEEYSILDGLSRDGPAPGSSGGSSGGSGGIGGANNQSAIDDRSIASSSGNQPFTNVKSTSNAVPGSRGHIQNHNHRPPVLTVAIGDEQNGSQKPMPSLPDGRAYKENGHVRQKSQLPPLQPMEPLSPIGL